MKDEKKVPCTFATTISVKEKAKKKAFKEGLTLSEKIDQLLKQYIKPKKKDNGVAVDNEPITVPDWIKKQR